MNRKLKQHSQQQQDLFSSINFAKHYDLYNQVILEYSLSSCIA